MQNAQYDWKKLSCSVVVEHGPKMYGKVTRKGKTFYRRYRHELKNGKGKSTLDIFIESSEDQKRRQE